MRTVFERDFDIVHSQGSTIVLIMTLLLKGKYGVYKVLLNSLGNCTTDNKAFIFLFFFVNLLL